MSPANSEETGGGVTTVHHEPQARGVYEIQHVVERGSQAVDVLAIKRSDETLIELVIWRGGLVLCARWPAPD